MLENQRKKIKIKALIYIKENLFYTFKQNFLIYICIKQTHTELSFVVIKPNEKYHMNVER